MFLSVADVLAVVAFLVALLPATALPAGAALLAQLLSCTVTMRGDAVNTKSPPLECYGFALLRL